MKYPTKLKEKRAFSLTAYKKQTILSSTLDKDIENSE